MTHDRDRADDGERELGFMDLEISTPEGTRSPPTTERRRAPASRSRTVETGGPLTVLVIDDDSPLRAAIRKMLEVAGYRVVEAHSGRVALNELRKRAPVHVVVSDLKMEDGSGGWLLAQLAYEFPELLSRTVVISGDPLGAGAAHIATRWRCPVLAKPFANTDLIGTVARLAHGDREMQNGHQ